ncbi:phage portal protein [Aeromonas caviae]|uniref:phage portal protein n=1 Tax=Aeromonas caviae TaxID=648 RepID=UPI001BD290DE|nr:phage portal protein [Aeromonas caviae]MBS4707321.1 phage portal protein [Aeromonas caviae]
MNHFNRSNRNVEVKGLSATDIANYYKSGGQSVSPVADPTVLACIKIIAETVGKLPAYLYRETETGDERIQQDKMLKVLTKKPNDFQTMQQFLEMVIYHLCTDGNFYAVINRSGGTRDKPKSGKVVSIFPVEHPSCVTPQLRQGKLIYSLNLNSQMGIQGYKTEYAAHEVLHIRMASGNLLKGLGCIAQARQAIELSTLQREHSIKFAETSSIPAGIVSLGVGKEEFAETAMHENIDALEATFANGAKASGKLAILQGAATYTPITVSNVDAQFLESRQFGMREICAIFRIPEHLISGAANVKYSNYGQSMLSFYTETISPYIARIQAAFNDHLDDLGICFALDETELKRGDNEQQRTNATELYSKGMITLNEARSMLNMNKVETGDNFNVQANNSVIGTLDEIIELQWANATANASSAAQEETEETEEPENNNNNEGINNESEEKLPLQAE